MMNNKKANAFAWITALGTLFIVGLLFVVLTNPITLIFNATNFTSNSTQYATTRSLLETTWSWWPALVLLGTLLWVFVQTLRRDTYGGYG